MKPPFGYEPCAMCKRTDRSTHPEPSRSALVFGFRNGIYKLEYRCSACERKLAKQIDKMLDNLSVR